MAAPDWRQPSAPARRVVFAWGGALLYVAVCVALAVFPAFSPVDTFLAAQAAVTLAFGVGLLGVARRAPRPLWVLLALSLFALAAFDLLKACPGVACARPPGYVPWRHVSVFPRLTALGPALGVSTDPAPCASVCPYRVELLPLVAGYWAVWKGLTNG